MSSNQSAIGKIGYRALTGAEIKEISIGEIAEAIRNDKRIKKFLTFHNFKLTYAYKITALADTPVPPEIEKFVEITARDFTDEELQALKGNVQALEQKLESLAPMLKVIEVAKKYLDEVKIESVGKDIVSDNRQPDVLRQRHNLPILVTQRVGPQIAEVPMENLVPNTNPPNPHYEPAAQLANSYSQDGGGTPASEMKQDESKKDVNLNV